MRLAVVLFNLGGPDTPAAVRPFLFNLFKDRAIITLPAIARYPLAWLIAKTRAPIARKIYEHLGGGSPILKETEEQARGLEAELARTGHEAKCFIAMRYWHPFTQECVKAVAAWKPEKIVLLPLYPQFSTTTTASSLDEWFACARKARLDSPVAQICCYPDDAGFIAAMADLIEKSFAKMKPGISYRLLFSAHGLPKRIVDAGDPYPVQVAGSVAAVMAKLQRDDIEHGICYQSRVGRLEWIGPATDAEIVRAGKEGKGVIIAPIAFVSEHSETLVELDIEYGKLARESGVPDYIRVPTVRSHEKFIAGLGHLATASLIERVPVNSAGTERICPADCTCGQEIV